MATKNDITGDSIISKTNTDKYRDNFDAVFKKVEPGYTGEIRKKQEEQPKEQNER